MNAQRGKDLLLKLDTDGLGTYTTVAGLRATRLSFNADTVDVSTVDSLGQWRELLANAGMRTAAISGSGVFKDAATDAAMRQMFFDGTIPSMQVVIPDFGTVTGPFQIAGLEYAGNFDGEAVYEVALASAGSLTFVVA